MQLAIEMHNEEGLRKRGATVLRCDEVVSCA